MRKILLSIVFMLAAAVGAQAQYTTVTATVVDPNATVYISGSYSVSLVNTSNQQATFGGNASFQQVYSGNTLSTAGVLSIVLPSVTSMSPLGLQWAFNICANPLQIKDIFPVPALPCFTYTSTGTQISGASVDISASLKAAAATIPLLAGSGGGVAITTVSGLASVPGFKKGTIAVVTDGSSATDCTVGGGTNVVACQYSGTVWAQLVAASSGSTAFSAITAGTSAAALVMGTGGSLTTSGTGTINANQVNGAAPPTSKTVVGTNSSGQVVDATTTTLPTAMIPAFTGDVTNSAGSLSTTVGKVNGLALPASKTIIGTNSSSQIIDASAATLANNTTGTAANLSGTPALPNGTTATTQSVADNSTKLATDAFVIANSVTNPMTTLGDVVYGGASGAFTRGAGPTTPNGVPQFWVEVPAAGAATAEQFQLAGVPTNPQTGASYTYLATDRASYTTFSNAGAIAVTLPQAGSAGFGSNFVNVSCDIGAGTATITPTTSTISYTNGTTYTSGATTLPLTTGQCAWIYSDNTNYFAILRTGGGGGGTVTSFSAGNLSPLFTTSVATATTTPALTFVLSNAAAGTVLGNPTGAAAGPIYTATPVLGVSGTAGTLAMFPASGNFTTTWGSAATASNTILGFATAPVTTDIIICVVSSTTCTLTDSGIAVASSKIAISSVGTAGLSGTAPVTISAAGAIGCATCNTTAAVANPPLDKSATGLSNPTADATFTYPIASTTGLTLAGTAPASVSTSTGTNATTLFNVNGVTGGADSNATGTGGIGSSPTIAGGVGGAGTGTNAVGGAGGSVSLTAGNGGASLGTGINSNGGNVVVTPGAAGTGGSGTAGLAGVLSVAGANAGFIGLTQGAANTTLNTRIPANTIIDQAPTAVTAYTQTRPGAASSGLTVNVNASNVITQTYTGDANHSVNLTAQTAAKTTTTLCAATAGTACGQAGQYHVHWNFWGSGTACATPGPGAVTFLLTWTDENAVTHSAVSLQMVNQTAAATTAMGSSFTFASALANESASGDFTFSTNGTIIQYATGYTACTTGTGTYALRAAVDQLQ